MNTSVSYSLWLESAYELFAKKGPEALTIKELARHCGLPRTNFYYYFENKEDLMDKIISLHFQTSAELFSLELSRRFKTFIPDLYVILYDFELGLQFAKQLFKHRDDPQFNRAYVDGVLLTSDLIVPKFKEFFKIDLPDEDVKKLWLILTDAWYSRLSFENFSVNYLCDLCDEIMDTIMPLIKNGQTIQSPF